MSDLTNLEKAMCNVRESARLAMNSLYGYTSKPVLVDDLPHFNFKIGFSTPNIERVIFNEPATIVFWADGTKTVVKCQPDDTYDKEKGLALCISKKYFGNKGNFNEVFKKFIPEEQEPVEIEKSVSEMKRELRKYCSSRTICATCKFFDDKYDCNFTSASDDNIRMLYGQFKKGAKHGRFK